MSFHFQSVLIPLVQGRFLFRLAPNRKFTGKGLNPFGSGTFFILTQHLATAEQTGLNPFGSGTFFIQYFDTKTLFANGLNPFGSGTFFISKFGN